MSPFIEQLTINDPVLLPLALSPLGLGDPSTRRYRTIKTLTLHWQDEALDHCAYGPAREARMLAKTFAEWGWQTEDYIIPVNNPAESIREFLKSKTDDSGGDELLIVYYVGHGFKSHQGPLSRPFAVGTQGHSSTDPVVLEWPVIRSVLEAAQSDVVMFLNCCHAADSWVSRNLEHDEYIGPTGKVMCILAATNIDEEAFMKQRYSFGTLLKRVLDSTRTTLGSDGSISIAMLVEAMNDEIEKSQAFLVVDVVRGGYFVRGGHLFMYPQLMAPSAHYTVPDRDIMFHRLGLHDFPMLHLYQRLSGRAGKYWEKLV